MTTITIDPVTEDITVYVNEGVAGGATIDGVQTLTNKTISLGSNTLSGTVAQFNAAVSDGDFVASGGALGTPTSGNLSNCTDLVVGGLTLPTARLVGRSTAGTGVGEAITIGSGLTLSAGTLSSSASSTLNGITAATGTATINNAENAIVWNWNGSTASRTGFTIGENVASTGGAGSQILFDVKTLAGSTADPFRVQSRGGEIIRVSSGGQTQIGASGTLHQQTGSTTITSANASSFNAPAITLTPGNQQGSTGLSGGNLVLNGGIANAANSIGGIIYLNGATSLAAQSGNSGGIVLTGGAGGATNVVGGPIVLTGGVGNDNTGGAINITGGASTGSGLGGTVNITGGVSRITQSGTSGGVVIAGGSAGTVASVAGARVEIKGGNGSSTTTSGVGGAVEVKGGSAGGVTAAIGGGVSIIGGTGSFSAAGGAAYVTGGNGGATGIGGEAGLQGGSGYGTAAGGDTAVYAGIGQGTGPSGVVRIGTTIFTNKSQSGDSGGVVIAGQNAGAFASVAGSPIKLTAGAGSTTTTGGIGGAINITAGAGGLAAAGGALTLTSGSGGASGAAGNLELNVGVTNAGTAAALTSNATRIALGGSVTSGGTNSVVIGQGASGNNAASVTVIGQNAAANGTSTTAIGNGAIASGGAAATAVGNGASATNASAVAISNNSAASGSSSIAIKGTASATNSVAIGINSSGQVAQAVTGSGAMALGGSYASGTDSFAAAIGDNTSTYGAQGGNSVAIGRLAKATGNNSCVIGGYGGQATAQAAVSIPATANFGNISSGTGSVAIGEYAKAAQNRKYVYTGGAFAAMGDAQSGKLVLRVSTNGSAAVMTSDGNAASAANQLIVESNQVMVFTGTLIGKQTGSANIAAYEIKGTLVNNAGTVTMPTGTLTIIGTDTIGLTTAPTLLADNTNKGLTVTAGAKAATSLRWVATVNSTEVVFA